MLYAAALLVTLAAGVPRPAQATGGMSADRLTALFEHYGDTSGRWSGGDRTTSVRLPDGRLLWLFSDTFLGPVNPDRSRPRSAAFINNSAVVQHGDELRETVHGGSAEEPASLVPPPAADQFHWIGDAQVAGDTLQVLVNRYRRTGSGPLDHALLGTALATFTLPELTPTGIRPLPLGKRISWGSTLLRDGGYTWVYGTEAFGQTKFAHVARVAGDDLAGRWEFWTGTDWVADADRSARILSGVGTSYGVQRVGGRYVLVTHENNLVFSADLVAYSAAAPTGPFEGPDYLHRAPETEAGHLVYDADLHPDLARPGKLLISYNVNNVDDAVTYADANVYRPRFIEVDWPRPRPDRADVPPAPAALTADARGAGNAELRWRPVIADDDLRYLVHRRDVTAGHTHFVRIGEPTAEPRWSADFLVNGHEYEFRVTTVGRRGESPPSPVARMTATVPPPPPPGGLRAEAGRAGDVTVRWNPLPFVQLFRLYQRDVTSGQREPALIGTFTGTSATVASLWHARTYEFTVVAVGGGGDSPPSAPVRATAFVTPPAAPTRLTAYPEADGDIRLTWAGLGPGVSYRVYRRDITAGQTSLGSPSLDTQASHRARYLEHGHEYEFAVSAVNSGGEGPISPPVRAHARFTAPRVVPTGLRVKQVGAGRVVLTWRSANPGGWHRVYRRDLTAREREFTEEEVAVQGNEAAVLRLRNGHEYEFAVAAVNQAGPGRLSRTVRATPRLPTPVGLVVTGSGTGEARLSWASAGPGLGYRVQLRDATAGGAWRTDPYPVAGTDFTAVLLARGHRYEFRVAATDGVDTGAPSAAVSLVVS
ncbi:fibronectin type III domain-containing protein [Micromonospora sp. C28SCA-DRY-2]|uniref:fibronectin type III domain-containing protein n=1 Tax=Micromonospora sp. C28SCA-DRY-2 TaxID=3059522 RepID=UPI0026761AB7|nr:fibronectin type III domain-containing protein [Micromonospora sp. C28SCA-DRY-2]MDO3703571.1 fibronectin type III domain-containing protein [Micromonospora sp. C28SCA-DRY-2]